MTQGVAQHGQEDMHPWGRLRLAHPEQAPMQHVGGMLLEGDQHEQEPFFRGGQGTVLRGRIPSCLPAPPMQGPCRHGTQEGLRKGGDQRRKLRHRQAGEISHVSGMGWEIAIP